MATILVSTNPINSFSGVTATPESVTALDTYEYENVSPNARFTYFNDSGSSVTITITPQTTYKGLTVDPYTVAVPSNDFFSMIIPRDPYNDTDQKPKITFSGTGKMHVTTN